MHESRLRTEIEGDVGRIVLNRPECMNALDPDTLDQLLLAARQLDESAVRVVVIEGEGRAFSVGADLNAFASLISRAPKPSGEELRAIEGQGRAMVDTISRMRAVTVASTHGYAIGGGLLLMLACDLRVAEADTVMSIPEVAIGIPLAWGGVPILTREIGASTARYLIMTCRRFGPRDVPGLSSRASRCRDLGRPSGPKPPRWIVSAGFHRPRPSGECWRARCWRR